MPARNPARRGDARFTRAVRRPGALPSLASADREHVEGLIQPTGFFRAKTEAIIKLSQALVEVGSGLRNQLGPAGSVQAGMIEPVGPEGGFVGMDGQFIITAATLG